MWRNRKSGFAYGFGLGYLWPIPIWDIAQPFLMTAADNYFNDSFVSGSVSTSEDMPGVLIKTGYEFH
ncbi:hypothetical protein [Oceanispirochaeta sp.]|jgi:hypothetical protein|uniref:hypothetical protein n=1 Tax=Oceanispirochaeta sp. TaxID=2035350 RepID=UPI002631D093|nr:hypothetical protein [Oceanispirochaeta sp.]MDA3958702.1 hypothetical protein [Oceanispirochaeta sp.]